MMKKYLETYKKSFTNSKRSIEKAIKSELIDFKLNHKNFYHAHDSISRKYHQDINNNILNQPPLNKLTNLFNNRFSIYEPPYELIILEKEIHDEYTLIENPKITFDQVILEFAHSEALKECITFFQNGRPVYNLMYDLKNFDDFKLINFGHFYQENDIFKKLDKQSNPEKYQTKSIEELPITKPSKNTFKLKPEYRSAIGNAFKSFKNILNNDDDDKILNLIEFKEIFEEDFTSHDHELHFNITNPCIYKLIEGLNPFFHELTLPNIERSGKFFNKKGKPLNADDLYHVKNIKCKSDKDIQEIISAIRNHHS